MLAVGVATGMARDARADVQLTMRDGRVSIVAKDATLQQILAEWARVGQTKIINGERVPGGPISLQLNDVPEAQALDILLHSLSGYMAAPRAGAEGGVSRFDRVVVMPTVAPPVLRTAPPPGAPPPTFQQTANPTIVQPQGGQPGAPFPPNGEDEDDQPQRPPVGRTPAFTAFPQPQVANPLGPVNVNPQTVSPAQGPLVLPAPGQQPQQQPMPAPPNAYPGVLVVPSGAAVPGMVVPPPQQQQPGRPAQPKEQ